MRNYYKHGTYNAICDVCGLKFKADMMKKRWDGMIVCGVDWEPRHPMDLYRHVPAEQPMPWVRPEAPDDYTVTPLTVPIT